MHQECEDYIYINLIRERDQMTRILFILITLSLFSPVVTANAADWLNLIQNENGDNHFIDMASITMTPGGNVSVREKVTPGTPSAAEYFISTLEVNCKQSSIRNIIKTIHYKKGKIETVQGTQGFKKIKDDEIGGSMLELICSLKKSQ